jgi:hypothetical protein
MQHRNIRYTHLWRDANSIQNLIITLVTTFLTPFILSLQRDYIVLWNVILFSAMGSPELTSHLKLFVLGFYYNDKGDSGKNTSDKELKSQLTDDEGGDDSRDAKRGNINKIKTIVFEQLL